MTVFGADLASYDWFDKALHYLNLAWLGLMLLLTGYLTFQLFAG